MQTLIDFLDKKGFIAEANSLKSGTTFLALNNRNIGAEGAEALAEALKNNNSITTLYLQGNQIGDEGAEALGEGLKTNTSIIQLYLDNNPIGNEVITQLQEYIHRNIKLAQENNPRAESLNNEGNIFKDKGEYNKAIEKYNAAIAIVKKPLYVKNKVNAEKEQAKQVLIAQQLIIQEIFKLTGEGDARIKEENEKGILILGKTGAGKSTLACLLANEELEVFEDNKGNLRLKTTSSYNGNVKIGHTTVSETKIPNNYKLEDVTIWDCPGFMDTRSTAQEIANAFYIQRLFETNKQLKFILTVTESDLNNRTNILPIVEQFTKGFTDIKPLKDSVTLVITKVTSSNKKPSHLLNAIEELKEQNSNIIDPKTKEMLEFIILKKSIQIFRCPTDEGIIPNSDMLKAIEDTSSM